MSDFEEDDPGHADEVSLTSSVREHTFENGRRYHSFGRGLYPLSNDQAEQEREAVTHNLMLSLTEGKLFYAPVGRGAQNIKDVGTGTGSWAVHGLCSPCGTLAEADGPCVQWPIRYPVRRW